MPEPAQEAEVVFLSALDKPTAAERIAYVESVCADKPTLLQRVRELLACHEESQGPLDAIPPLLARTIDASAVTALPGTMIGPYKLLQQIGEGGMGTVYMAEQTEPIQRKVALKIIKAGMDSRQVIARFEAERQALAMMDHVNIARVFDGGATESGRPYFVMELVHGVSITKYCDDNHLTPRERLELFVPVCQAIQHAHQKGIIHRDLKPSNVMVTLYDGKPVPKVIDFGVAKATEQKLTERTLFTQYGIMVGTLEYMSPEQAEPSALGVDTRSDIYALGVLLYEMLTGSTPLTHKRVKEAAYAEVLRMIKEEEPPKPSKRLSDSGEALPSISAQRHMEPAKLTKLMRGELDWIVMKTLEKDRNRRYETASAVGADVQHYLNDEPVQAGPPSAGYRLRKFARRNRRSVLDGLALAGLLVLGTAGTSMGLVWALKAEAAASAAATLEAQQRWVAETQLHRAITAEKQAVAEKQRADDEAAVARAVNQFLQKDLLGQADIANQADDSGRNPNVAVRVLLDRAAQQIEGKFAGQEATEGAIRLTLGDAYLALGDYAEAQKHLERSLDLRRRKLGADSPDTLTSMNHLAGVYSKRGRYDQAELLYQQALAGRRSKLGADHPDTLESMLTLGVLYWHRGHYDQAESRLKEVLEACRSNLGIDHALTLFSMQNLATVYQARGRDDEAEALQKQALEACRSKLGASHPWTLTSMNRLAVHYQIRGRYDEAETLHKQVLEARRAKLGADHPDMLQTMANLAAVYQARGREDEAEALHKQALEACRSKLGADHPLTLQTISNLASLYQTRGRDDDAELLYKEALEGYRVGLGVGHHNTEIIRNCLAALYHKRGRDNEAEHLLRDAVAEARKKNEGLDSPPDTVPLGLLALNLLQQKKYVEAEPIARECLAIRTKKEPDAWTTNNARSLLGGALLGQKKYADAEPLLLAGYEGMKQRESKIPASGKVRLTEALERLVQLYDVWGKKGKADEWQRVLAAHREAGKRADKRKDK